MHNRKKILVFSPDLHAGGVANVVSHTLQMYAGNSNYETAVVVYENTKINFGVPANVAVFQLNIPYYVSSASTRFSKFLRATGRIFLFPVAFIKAFLLFRKIKPDVVISHGILCNIITVFFKKKYKVVLVEHGVPFRLVPSSASLSNFLLFFNKRIYKKVDRFVAISDLIRSNYIEKFHIDPTHIHKIVNPVDAVKINHLKAEDVEPEILLLTQQHKVLVTACRLIEQKSIHTIIEAVKYLADNGRNELKVLIIGDGPLKNEHNNLIIKYGLQQQIIMTGFRSNPYKYIDRCYAYLSASIYEGYPVSLIEAISLGKPIVATDCESGPREIAGNTYIKTGNIEIGQCGILTPVLTADQKPSPDVQAFAEGMVYMLEHEELYENFCINAREMSKKNDINHIAQLWYKLIDNI